MRRIYVIALCLLIYFQSNGQDHNSKALEILKQVEPIQNPNKVLKFLSGIVSPQNLNDSLRTVFYYQKGVAYGQLGSTDSSLLYLSNSKEISSTTNNDFLLIRSLNAEALVYGALGRYDDALKSYQEALNLIDKDPDKYYISAIDVLGNAAGIFYQLGEVQSAIGYTQRALAYSIKKSDTSGLAYNNLRLAIVYESADSLDISLEHLNLARNYLEILGDTVTLLFAEDTQGTIYKKLNQEDAALKHYLKAMEYAKALEHIEPLIHTINMVSDIKLKQGKLNEAESYAKELLLTATKINHLRHQRNAHQLLYEIAYQRDDLKKAIEELTISHALNDSLNNIDKKERVAEIQTKYETAQKEKQITELQKQTEINELEAQQERQYRYLLILAALALIVVVGLVYNRYRLKNRSEKLLAEKNEQLTELNKTKNRLFSIIAHDLKSPLSAFSMLVGALKENSQSLTREELDEYLNTILDSSEDINKLLINLLDWARIQSNNMIYKPEEEDIRKAVDKAYEPLRLNSKLKNLSFINETSGTGYFDDIMIVTVLRNLISNAIKFTPEGGSISVSNEERDEYNIITITDTGIGMNENEMSQLFNTKRLSSSSKNGTGLGLIICRDLIEKHGGKIDAVSEPGNGSVFRVFLPVKQEHMQVA